MEEVFKVPVQPSYPRGCFFKSLEDIKGKKVTVMGLGLNGGGEAVVKFLLKNGASVVATDMKTKEQLQSTIDSIESWAAEESKKDSSINISNLTYILGEHRLEDFENADCVIKNPGVKYDGNKFLAASKNIETDISLFLNFTKAPIIAITGAKGKSSTVSAIHYGLCQAGFECYLGGNITVSPLTFLEKTTEKTPVVLELSSWQLGDLKGRGLLKPKIALITKIIPDHQNFYHSMLAYVDDKKLIYASQTKDDFAIFDFDDDESADGGTLISNWGNVFARETKAKVFRYSTKKLPEHRKIDGKTSEIPVFGVYQDKDGNGIARLPDSDGNVKNETILKEISVPGRHMRMNVLNAALVMRLMGVEAKKIQSILGSWSGIEHRLEFFHEWGGIKFYNDSAATVPEAAAEASQAFSHPLIFISGGTDKGLSMHPVAEILRPSNEKSVKPRSIYLLAGTATDKVVADFNAEGIKYNGPYDSLESLLKAVKADFENCGETLDCVFSPGATSFGMFTNEFDRGRKFKACVKEIFS